MDKNEEDCGRLGVVKGFAGKVQVKLRIENPVILARLSVILTDQALQSILVIKLQFSFHIKTAQNT